MYQISSGYQRTWEEVSQKRQAEAGTRSQSVSRVQLKSEDWKRGIPRSFDMEDVLHFFEVERNWQTVELARLEKGKSQMVITLDDLEIKRISLTDSLISLEKKKAELARKSVQYFRIGQELVSKRTIQCQRRNCWLKVLAIGFG